MASIEPKPDIDWELPPPLYLASDNPVHIFAERYKLLALWNAIWYAALWILLVALVTAALWVPGVSGLICVVLGSAILRIHYPTQYANNWESASIGLAGGTFVGLPSLIAVFCAAMLQAPWYKIPGWLAFIITIIYGTLAGVVGSSSIKLYYETRQVADISHATCAGFLGGIVVGALFLLPMLIDALSIFRRYFKYNLFSSVDVTAEEYMSIPLFDMDAENVSGSENGLLDK